MTVLTRRRQRILDQKSSNLNEFQKKWGLLSAANKLHRFLMDKLGRLLGHLQRGGKGNEQSINCAWSSRILSQFMGRAVSSKILYMCSGI